MTTGESSRGVAARLTRRLEEITGAEPERVFRVPSGGDWLLLGVLVAILLGNGVYVWHQLGLNDRAGQAVFFGLALVCAYWSALVYTFKLSLSVRVGSEGIALVRGPWRTEIAWSEVARLSERREPVGGAYHLWVIIQATNGRAMELRQDLVADYLQFRQAVYAAYRHWLDHGGTWGTAGMTSYTVVDNISGELLWWLFAASITLLPGLYLWTMLRPETGVLGLAISGAALVCLAAAARTALRRQRYAVTPTYVESRKPLQRTLRLSWREVGRVDRTRRRSGALIALGVLAGQGLLALAGRTDNRYRSFMWTPRVPDYLVLRGGGRQVRVRLHRLVHPDEMLAWVEFYERAGRHTAASRATRAPERMPQLASPTDAIPDLATQHSPTDPWGQGRGGTAPGTNRGVPYAAPGTTPAEQQPQGPWQGTSRRSYPSHPSGPPAGYVPAPQPGGDQTAEQAAAGWLGNQQPEDENWIRETEAHVKTPRYLQGVGPGQPQVTPRPPYAPYAPQGPAAPAMPSQEQGPQGSRVPPRTGSAPSQPFQSRRPPTGPLLGGYNGHPQQTSVPPQGQPGGPQSQPNSLWPSELTWRDAESGRPILPRFGPTLPEDNGER